MIGLDVDGRGSVDWDHFVGAGIVGMASCDAKDIIMSHLGLLEQLVVDAADVLLLGNIDSLVGGVFEFNWKLKNF